MKDDELLDLVNEKDEVIGTVWKSVAHKDPKLIHREVAIAIFDKKGEVLIQQRSMNKVNDPGAWKVSAAGHVGAGEDPKKAVAREVLEELGIKVIPIFLKKKFAIYKDIEARFYWIYYAIIKNIETVKIDTNEVNDAKWLRPEDLKKFSEKNDWDLNSTSHEMIMEVYKIISR